MLVVIFGTTGELIKLAPVLRRLQDRDLPYLSISTNQQVTQIPPNQLDLGLKPTDIELVHGHRGRDLEKMMDIAPWAAEVARGFLRNRKTIKHRLVTHGGRHVVMVHGDPMTTVYGAAMGRLLGLPVAHLEAGMRSHNWRNPFPEEIDRTIAGYLARIHYANTDVEVSNLRRARGHVVKIGANTVFDAITLVPPGRDALSESLGSLAPAGEFGLFSIHRTELIEDRDRLASILKTVAENRPPMPLLFVDHPVTMAALRKHGLEHLTEDFVRIPRQRYIPFIGLLRDCSYMVTDSGGCQEECTYLDIPCVVHRLVTERNEGIGSNVVLSGYDLNLVRDFLSHPSRWRTGSKPDFPSPSDIVVNDLIQRGVWQ